MEDNKHLLLKRPQEMDSYKTNISFKAHMLAIGVPKV
jgi:hypothetical protein